MTAEPGPRTLTLRAPDGSSAVIAVPFPPLPPVAGADPGADPSDAVAAVTAHALADRRVLVLLLRRGGYACVRVEGGRVSESKVGRRHVQGRTAAGGSSQQRFARRRENQTAQAVDAAVETAARLLLPVGDGALLATGGDRRLIETALADRRLAALAALPRGPHLAVPDPRADLVARLPALLTQLRIELLEPIELSP
jgi:hypothetical protein